MHLPFINAKHKTKCKYKHHKSNVMICSFFSVFSLDKIGIGNRPNLYTELIVFL